MESEREGRGFEEEVESKDESRGDTDVGQGEEEVGDDRLGDGDEGDGRGDAGWWEGDVCASCRSIGGCAEEGGLLAWGGRHFGLVCDLGYGFCKTVHFRR